MMKTIIENDSEFDRIPEPKGREVIVNDWDKAFASDSTGQQMPYVFSKNGMLKETLTRANVPAPVDDKSIIKIKENVEIDSNDKEEIALIQGIYQNSLHHYERVQQILPNILDKDFLAVVEELQLIVRNILVRFNEKPYRIIQNSHFIDYYQDRFAQFVEKIVDSETNAVNPDKTSISQLKELVANLKPVFKSTYNTLSETDMNDLTAEIKTMEQSLSEYTQNIDATVPEAVLKDNISSDHIDSKVRRIKNKSPEEIKQAQLKEQAMNLSIGVGLGIGFVVCVIAVIILLYVFL